MPVPSPNAALVRHLAALRHDLGKYVALQVRSAADADEDELHAALVADLLHTRREASASVDAAALFDALAPALRGEAPLDDGSRADLRGDPDFDALCAAMARLRPVIDTLRAGGRPDDPRQAAADALEASARTRTLHRRHAPEGRIRG